MNIEPLAVNSQENSEQFGTPIASSIHFASFSGPFAISKPFIDANSLIMGRAGGWLCL
jgi:hypothetical protein